MTKTWTSQNEWGITIHIGSSHPPVYQQIVDQIRFHIVAGHLALGQKLPTVRELASALEINFNTVSKAYHDLSNQKLITGHKGGGSLVAEGTSLDTDKKKEEIERLFQRFLREAASYGVKSEEIKKYLKEEMP